MESQKRHRCPKCGYDYEPWIEICPDCGVLVENVASEAQFKLVKGTLDPNEDPRWTVVTNVPNAIIGNLIKSQLEDAGIPVVMQRSPSADIAQFSHNDYVPHDLRVPFHMLEEARRLLDSGPDTSPGAPYWGSDMDDEEEGESTGSPPFTSLSGPPSNVPEGWTMLPTERDVRARQWYQRGHGEAHREEADQSWYWSDSAEADSNRSRKAPRGVAASEQESRSDDDPLEADKIRFSQPYEREYYDETSGGQSKWVRIFYGILLLAISLPFLFQLLQQIASFFSFDTR